MQKIFLVITAILFVNSVQGQCQLETKRLTIFKDATVFVQKQGDCSVSNKQITILPFTKNTAYQAPTAQLRYNSDKVVSNHIILGTLEAICPGNRLISSALRNVDAVQAITSFTQILNLNKGKKVKVKLIDQKQEVEGLIFSVNTPIHISGQKSPLYSLVLQSGDSWKFIRFEDVESFQFVEAPITEKTVAEKKLVLEVKQEKVTQPVELSYLQKGISWTPNYYITIIDEKELSVSLMASIVNDIEDVTNATVDLAVGIPVFKYARVGDPLFSNQRVIELIAALSNPDVNNQAPMLNLITSQRYTRYIENYGNNLEPLIEGQGKDDIFLYHLSNISMQKGERIVVPILTTKANYDNIYVVELKANREDTQHNRNREEDSNLNHVWHAIQFKNNSGLPLTTGSVFFKQQKEAQTTPISQGELSYTPENEETTVKMAITPSIFVNDMDIEIARERVKDQYYYNNLITIEATIELVNFKNEKVSMEVTREVTGKLISSDQQWEVANITKELNSLNPNNLIKWSFALGPKENKTIKYKYKRYVR